MTSKNSVPSSSERCNAAIPQLLDNRYASLKWETDVDEEVWNPPIRTNVTLAFKRVSLDQGNEELGVECIFRAAESVSHLLQDVDDGFVGKEGGVGIILCFVVSFVKEVLPGCVDIGFIAVVGCLVDLEADIVIARLIGVVVEELRFC